MSDAVMVPTVDDLAREIRRVDGINSLGAGALAEALMPFLAASTPVGGWEEPVAWTNRANLEILRSGRGAATMWPSQHATDSTPLYAAPPPPSVSTGSRPQEAVPTEGHDAAVVSPEKWEWWASCDEENYTVGPEGSRADVIDAALCDFDGEPFHVVEACKGSMASYLPSGQHIIEWMQECADDNGAFGDDQYCELTGSAEAIAAAESDATAVLADWLARHAAIFPTPWAFRATRNAEWVSPAEVGAQALSTPQPADGCSSNEGAE